MVPFDSDFTVPYIRSRIVSSGLRENSYRSPPVGVRKRHQGAWFRDAAEDQGGKIRQKKDNDDEKQMNLKSMTCRTVLCFKHYMIPTYAVAFIYPGVKMLC